MMTVAVASQAGGAEAGLLCGQTPALGTVVNMDPARTSRGAFQVDRGFRHLNGWPGATQAAGNLHFFGSPRQ